MRLISSSELILLNDTITELRSRVRELEVQNSGLVDRLLIQQGQPPLDQNLGRELKEGYEAENDLLEALTAEEIGEYAPEDGAVPPVREG